VGDWGRFIVIFEGGGKEEKMWKGGKRAFSFLFFFFCFVFYLYIYLFIYLNYFEFNRGNKVKKPSPVILGCVGG